MPRLSRADSPLLSVEEAAVLLGQSRSSLYRSIHKGDLPLPLIQISGRWRIPRRAVERLVNGEGLTDPMAP
jgi:excisionase family DNA binding protein